MPLSLIVGPPNSGRAGTLLGRFLAGAGADPVLVVPTRDDLVRFERDLCAPDGAGHGALLGGAVMTFETLFVTVARATGASSPNPLTSIQRLHLVRLAIEHAELRVLAASARSRGFAPAVERLLGELQSTAIDPAALGADGSAADIEMAEIYDRYLRLCAELGALDQHGRAAASAAALRRSPDAWGRRPVFLYGFDDLTPEQLDLVDALAQAAEVTVAVTFEDRAALSARSRLLGELADGLGGRVVERLAADDAYTDSATLAHLDRHLFEPGAARIEPDAGLQLLEAAGARSEAEQVGIHIARLLADGVRPDDIAVVLRHPDADGPLLHAVLSSLGIPVAAEASIPLPRTCVGQSLAALLRSVSDGGGAEDVLAFLRAPGGSRPQTIDWVERALLRSRARSAEEALAEWQRRGRALPWELEAVREEGTAAERLLALGRVAAALGERSLRRLAATPDGPLALELRASHAARNAFEELASLRELAPEPRGALAALDDVTVPLWSGPVEGRVRIVSPYRVRAGRARHLFVCSLLDGEFPSPGGAESLLGDERRELLGLPARRAPLDEERYLFHACVSRPTDRLYLSTRDCDEDGLAAVPSPFLDDVRDLLAPAPETDGADPVRERLTARRGLESVVFAPADAPTAAELARALAILPEAGAKAWARSAGVPEAIAAPALDAIVRARRRGSALPGPLRAPGVIAELTERRLYGASTLEEYIACPYRWFVQHELRPQSVQPKPDPLTQGGIIHAALERLYREQPGETAVPRPENLDAWVERGVELIRQIAAEEGISVDRGGGSRVSVARMVALLQRFLRRQTLVESPLAPDPELLEASFGTEGAKRPALPIGDFELRGMIDRIDVSSGETRSALVQDYKLGRRVTAAAKLEDKGKLQLQLYAIAARKLWGLQPIGAVYHPLGARGESEARARGLLARDERDGLLAGAAYVGTDFLEQEDFDAVLDRAAERAEAVVAQMRAGEVRRRPLDDKCPTYCKFQPICRRERAASLQPEPDEEENGT
jgi:ATP-dependent helicase/DNAse subunit B